MAFLCLGATTLFAQTPTTDATAPLRLAVISDVHVMQPDLLRQEGEAFADYIRNDRKMLKLGPSLLNNAVERILKEHPQVVLVTGDLTKDGETVSHLYLRDNYLRRLREAGIRVFVIPGNHDVDNPHAVEFLGDTTRRVPTPKADEFARIYTDYGFGEATARDTASLSYAVQLDAKTRLLCLDACEYYDNDYAKNICVTKGHLKPATLAFIKLQCDEAKAQGQRVLAMMHHGLVQHWKWQDKAMSEYVVKDWRKVADFFKKNGIEVCFTGHFHSQDISRRGGKKAIYDIETGSLVSYPSPIRFVTLAGKQLSVRTEQVSSEGLTIPDGQSLSEYGQFFARSIIHTYVGNLLGKSLPADVCDKVCHVVARAYVANLAGDETMPEDGLTELKAVAHEVRHHSTWKNAYILRHITKYLWQDEAPTDNSLTITLQK